MSTGNTCHGYLSTSRSNLAGPEYRYKLELKIAAGKGI